ncbi:DUF6443 domain-containing protein, partial [Belliella sp. DSM 111904]
METYINNIAFKGYLLIVIIYVSLINESISQTLSVERNLIRKERIFVPNITTDAQVINLQSTGKAVSISYFDHLGRKSQDVIWQASPSKKDIVQPYAYDNKGRQDTTFLPYTASLGTGSFKPSPTIQQRNFYNTANFGIPQDTRPYLNTIFEDSPDDTPLRSNEIGAGFETKFDSVYSKVNSAVFSVRKWTIVNSLPRSTSTYLNGELSYTETIDRAGLVNRQYTDWMGRVVLSQNQATGTTWLNTYYVYNDYNELIFVIPPQASTILTPTQANVDMWCFQHEYDALGRKIGTKTPGAGWVYTIYDRWDRPVLSQDSLQRSKNPKEWTFVKYDIHNRPIMTGVFTSSSTRAALTTAVANSITRDEIRNSTSVGYSLNRTYPTTVQESNLLTIEYYDDYYFIDLPNWSNANANYQYGAVSGYSGTRLTSVKGLSTGSKSRQLGGGNPWMYSVTYFDKYYQPIQQISSHQLSGFVKTVTQYAFSGEVQKTLNIYRQGTTEMARIERSYTYDHAGRVLRQYHKVNSQPNVLLASYTYNELGGPVEVIHHSRNNGNNYLYKQKSETTIQGWLSEIKYLYSNNNVVFQQKLDYQKAAGNANTSRFDGMISSNQWKHMGSGELERSYTYTYNVPKRLTSSVYKQKSGTTWTTNDFFTENNISYSANGNITTLNRRREKSGTAAVIDQLTYTYSGNQLTSVTDAASASNKADGFNDGNATGIDYEYNPNGFLKLDRNKGITNITYNILDRPEKIEFGSSKEINYTYSPNGAVLKQTISGFPTGNKTIQYVGELVYENGVLTDINHEFGRVRMNTGLSYQYYLTDYLGNTRVVLQEDPSVFTTSAGFELDAIDSESQQFIGYEDVTRIASTMMNHTDGYESEYAMRLSGGYGENMGLAKTVSVLPGDTVRMEVFGKYIDLRDAKTNPAVMAVLMGLTGGNPTGFGVDGGMAARMANTGSETGSLAGILSKRDSNNDAPPAYLNYLFF